ncbi:MAG: hypothetical protein A2Y07_03905 [Planctomycetes bacterium GWF2_50_10]|nr:MAG: hypothetical protein A2Y07_03905 [Planctomycetes bacterium GWF2_50_10]
MLKLNASYSKKVPSDSEYSSQSYHCSVEVEISDGVSDTELQKKIHDTFMLVRESVEAELNERFEMRDFRKNGHKNYPDKKPDKVEQASEKQIHYLTTLAERQGIVNAELCSMAGVKDLNKLGRKECSNLIDRLTRKAA